MRILVDRSNLGFQHNGYSHMLNLFQKRSNPKVERSTRVHFIYQNLDNTYYEMTKFPLFPRGLGGYFKFEGEHYILIKQQLTNI